MSQALLMLHVNFQYFKMVLKALYFVKKTNGKFYLF
jgi:hypothetical protein